MQQSKSAGPKIPVMVTGIGGGGHGEQILKALRMANTPYEIVGCDLSPYSKGLKEVDHPYLVPPARDPQYIDTILRLCTKHKVRALFHGSEPELLAMSRNREVFIREGIFLPINPEHVIETCMSKSKTFQFLEKNGFLYPKTRVVKDPGDLNEWSYIPAILKPSVGSGGSAHTFIAQSREELKILATYMLNSKVCPEMIVQEYKGTPETEFTVGVLFDMDGTFLNSIAVRRDLRSSLSCRTRVMNRTGLSEYGQYLSVSTGISQGEIGPFPEVTGPCEKIAKALGACGAINIQCRIHLSDVYVFEINPRFSGTTSIRAVVGYNEPDILIRKHVLGESIAARFPYKTGMVVRGLVETLFEKDDVDRWVRAL
ncbi:ATP-grasp domain-containing protein [Candidatus Bathyarchaeota archaeon]|nr:ATP-grasp domain-containing protein [Candidatus Bathyarchaeota archaeon]